MISFLNTYTSTNNSWPKLFSAIGQLLVFLLIFIFVVSLSIYLTKIISSVKINKLKNKNMKVLEILPLGYQNYIQVLKVYDKYILIGINKNNITFLFDLTDSSENIEKLNEKSNNFKSYIDKFYNIKRNYSGDSND